VVDPLEEGQAVPVNPQGEGRDRVVDPLEKGQAVPMDP
jgi:hypothetical protein